MSKIAKRISWRITDKIVKEVSERLEKERAKRKGYLLNQYVVPLDRTIKDSIIAL